VIVAFKVHGADGKEVLRFDSECDELVVGKVRFALPGLRMLGDLPPGARLEVVANVEDKSSTRKGERLVTLRLLQKEEVQDGQAAR
jgi:hypothetical protein